MLAATNSSEGHAWLEVDSQAPTAIRNVKHADPERYRDVRFIDAPRTQDFMATIPFTTDATIESLREEYASFSSQWWPATTQSPEILVAASHCLRSGELGLRAERVVLSGLSQTGGVTRRFVTHSSHLRLPNGSRPFEAFIPCQSGGLALPDAPGAKIVELLGEAEFQNVRLPCGVGGQAIGTSHQRPDSDSFRLYEVAGMAHRESRYPSEQDKKRWSVAQLSGARWSTFSNSCVYHAVFALVERWTRELDFAPPPSATLETADGGDGDLIHRDEHGNALGGVRTLHTEAPLAQLVAATPKGRPNWYCGESVLSRILESWIGARANGRLIGSEWPFEPTKLSSLYHSVWNYRVKAGAAIYNQVRRGFLLDEDAGILRKEVVEEVIF